MLQYSTSNSHPVPSLIGLLPSTAKMDDPILNLILKGSRFYRFNTLFWLKAPVNGENYHVGFVGFDLAQGNRLRDAPT